MGREGKGQGKKGNGRGEKREGKGKGLPPLYLTCGYEPDFICSFWLDQVKYACMTW